MKKLDNKTIEDAFDDIKLICDNAQFDEEFSIYEEYQEQFDIVESALNELHERREMMQRFNEASVPSVIDDDTYKKLQTTLTYSDVQSLILIRNKYEQVLEIIKKYYVFEKNQFCSFKRKNIGVSETKEEYDLLDEALNNGR